MSNYYWIADRCVLVACVVAAIVVAVLMVAGVIQ